MSDDLEPGDRDERPEKGRGGEGGDREPRRSRNLLGFVLVIGVLVLFVVVFGQKQLGRSSQKIELGEFNGMLERGEVKELTLEGDKVEGELHEGGKEPRYFSLTIPKEYWTERTVTWTEDVTKVGDDGKRQVVETKERSGTYLDFVVSKVGEKNFHYESSTGGIGQILLATLPWVVLFVLFYFFVIRQMRMNSGAGGVLSFGRSRARLAGKERTNITFADVAGMDEALEEVREIIEFLKDPGKFQRIGARVPRGVLLVGPPGTGKTLLAKAIAGEAAVPFFSICGSDFVEMFVGVGASRVRDLFKQAKEKAPCIVFLDEIDAVGRRRGAGLGGGHDEREQTLNSILVEMDGFETDEGIIIISATNRPDVLDPALTRPGRFDRQITIDLPDVRGREGILKVHARRIKLDPDVDLKVLARSTPGFSGADLEAVLNEAALLAVMRAKKAVEMEDCEEARDKVRWGREKKSRVIEEADRKITAYHESGHALIPYLVPELEPLHKVTIIPRGMTGGSTMLLPTKEETHLSRKKLLGMVKLLYAGRIAEAIFCDDISSGASNDIERATELVRRMVCIWGMSDALGPLKYEEDEDHVFLGREITRTRHHSEATISRIDTEVQRISSECYEETKRLILENRDKVEKMAQALLRFETLDAEDVAILMKGGDAEAIQAAREVENLRRRGDEKPQELGAKNRERARGQAKTDDGGLQARGEPAY